MQGIIILPYTTAVICMCSFANLLQAAFSNIYVFKSKEHMEKQPRLQFTAKLKVVCDKGRFPNYSELTTFMTSNDVL